MESPNDIYTNRQLYMYLDIRIAQLSTAVNMTQHQYMEYIMIPYGFGDRRYCK